jgi:hypothetical protein
MIIWSAHSLMRLLQQAKILKYRGRLRMVTLAITPKLKQYGAQSIVLNFMSTVFAK